MSGSVAVPIYRIIQELKWQGGHQMPSSQAKENTSRCGSMSGPHKKRSMPLQATQQQLKRIGFVVFLGSCTRSVPNESMYVPTK